MDFSEKLDLPEAFHVPYGRQLLIYAIDMAYKITGKIPPDVRSWHEHRLTGSATPHSTEESGRLSGTVSPQDCQAVLEEIRTILKEEGPLMPWQIERRLAERHGTQIPDHLLNTAASFAALDHQPEPMTDWNQKAFGGLIVAQAALYKDTTNTPVTIFDGDLSNMRGTNELYYWLLCMESGHQWEGMGGARDPALMAQAQALTDRAARILAAIALRESSRGDGVASEGIRNGGDELRIVAFGFPEDKIKAQETVEKIHTASEIATARMGLHDHPHAKPDYENDPNRNGFGNAIGWFWLPTDDINFAEGAHQAEAETDNAKIDLGKARREGKYESCKIEAYKALSGQFFSMPETEEEKANLSRLASNYLKASRAAMETLESELGIGPPYVPGNKPVPNLHRLGKLAGERNFDRLPQDSELRDLIAEAFRNSLTDTDKTAFEALDEKDKRLVEMMAAHAPMRDYVSGAYAGQDLPALADITFQVNNSLHRRALENTPEDAPNRSTIEKANEFFAISTSINISGVNKHLGHESTNALLEHFNENILNGALSAASLRPENACIVSFGGGDFTILLQNVVQNPDGNWRAIEEKDVQKITQAIADSTRALNDVSSTSFLREEFNKASKAVEYPFIGNVPDARQENVTGIRLFSTYQKLSVPADRHDSGGLIAGRILYHFRQEKEKFPAPTADFAGPKPQALPIPA